MATTVDPVAAPAEAAKVAAPAIGPGRPGLHHSQGLTALAFCAPALLIYTLFMVWPLASSIRLSLFNDFGHYVGLANFRTLFGSASWSGPFWRALRQSLVFFAFHCLVQNPVGLALAALLTMARIRGTNIYRTLIFVPTTLSVVVVSFIWRLILSPLWGIVQTPLLGQPSTALPTLSLISVWQWVGIPMMFFYATLIAIPKELIDASRVDGASSWRTFWRVSFPLVLPMFGIITVVTYIANLNAFDLVFTAQGVSGPPAFSTDILGTFFYRAFYGTVQQFGSQAMGATVATAMFGVVLIGLLVFFVGWRRRVRTYQF